MKHFEAHEFRRELPSEIDPHELDSAMTERRGARFRQVLARRIVGLTVIVEECFDPHNATAVIRTCEAFGIHCVHVVTGHNRFKINKKISQGAHRYVDVHSYGSIREAYTSVRESGFRIFASSLASDAVVDPHELCANLDSSPIALVFGNEESGVTDEGLSLADGSFFIPMCGFTQSLNLSVTVAVTLFSIRHVALASENPGDMPVTEQKQWYDRWIRRQTGVKRQIPEGSRNKPETERAR
jgi:tRNA (guanosine-2'-O-)-methyltransferase